METQRWEESEKRRAEERRSEKKKSQKKEDAGARKGSKVAKHCVFPMICAPEGRKVGSLKRRVRSHLARWEMKSCKPLWREAHVEVKMYKTPHFRSTFGSWDVEKMHAAVARRCAKHISKSKVLNTDGLKALLGCWKSVRRCGAKHFFKSKCTKHTMLGPLLEVDMSKKCTLLWREAHFEVKSVKSWRVRSTFARSDVVLRGRRKGFCTFSKVSKMWGFCRISKNDGRRGTLEQVPWQAHKRHVHQSC